MGNLAQTHFLNTAYKPLQLNGIFGNSFVELPTKQQDFALKQAYEIAVLTSKNKPELAKSLFINISERKHYEILTLLHSINQIAIHEIARALKINSDHTRVFDSGKNVIAKARQVIKTTEVKISDEEISTIINEKELFVALCEIKLPIEVLLKRIRMAKQGSPLYHSYYLTRPVRNTRFSKTRTAKQTDALVAYTLYREKLSIGETARILGLSATTIKNKSYDSLPDSILYTERVKSGVKHRPRRTPRIVEFKPPSLKIEPEIKAPIILDARNENDIYKTWLYSKGDMNKTARTLDRSEDDLLEQINSSNKEPLLYRIKIAVYLEKDIYSAQVLTKKDLDAILAGITATNDNDYNRVISRIFLKYKSIDISSALLTFWLNKFTQKHDYKTALEMACQKVGYTRSTAELRIRESKPPNSLARFKSLYIHYPNQLPPIDSFHTSNKYTIVPTNSEYSDADIYNAIQASKTFYSAFDNLGLDIVVLFNRIQNADFDSPLTWLKLLLNNKALRPESITKDIIAYVIDIYGIQDFDEAISILTDDLGLKIRNIEHHILNAPKDHRLSLYKNRIRGYGKKHSPTTSHTRKRAPKKTLSHGKSIELIMTYIYRNKLKMYDSATISKHTGLSISFVESVKFEVLLRYPDKTIQF